MKSDGKHIPCIADSGAWEYNDGGRSESGYIGSTGDCVTRAIAIATGKTYSEVYSDLFERQKEFGKGRSRAAKKAAKKPSPRTGVFREVYEPYLLELGWVWVGCKQVGSSDTVHLRPDELPTGRIITRLSKHLCAVVNGVAQDIYNPTRGGTRMVYGYYIKSNK